MHQMLCSMNKRNRNELDREWTCTTCRFVNAPHSAICICGALCPQGWVCRTCNQVNRVNRPNCKSCNAYKTHATWFIRDWNKWFKAACKSGDIARAVEAAEKGSADSRIEIDAGFRIACKWGHRHLAAHLVAMGAEDLNGALHDACLGGHVHVCDWLVERGAEANWNYLLWVAQENGHRNVAKWTVERGGARADFNMWLSRVCMEGDRNMAAWLVRNGANDWASGLKSACKHNQQRTAAFMVDMSLAKEGEAAVPALNKSWGTRSALRRELCTGKARITALTRVLERLPMYGVRVPTYVCRVIAEMAVGIVLRPSEGVCEVLDDTHASTSDDKKGEWIGAVPRGLLVEVVDSRKDNLIKIRRPDRGWIRSRRGYMPKEVYGWVSTVSEDGRQLMKWLECSPQSSPRRKKTAYAHQLRSS